MATKGVGRDGGPGAHAGDLQPPETLIVTSKRVKCDGGGGPLGHPLVYFDMGEADFVECNYCDRRYVLAEDAHGDAH